MFKKWLFTMIELIVAILITFPSEEPSLFQNRPLFGVFLIIFFYSWKHIFSHGPKRKHNFSFCRKKSPYILCILLPFKVYVICIRGHITMPNKQYVHFSKPLMPSLDFHASFATFSLNIILLERFISIFLLPGYWLFTNRFSIV